MNKIIFSLLILLTLKTLCWSSTLTAGYTPVVAQGGTTPQLQNASIYDTGTNSGSGNVGIGSTNPGKTLDIQGTVRANGFFESGIPVSTGGGSYACWTSSGQLISHFGVCH